MDITLAAQCSQTGEADETSPGLRDALWLARREFELSKNSGDSAPRADR
jgi:hypothetical protein